mmetsp:Transcript_35990/g.84348  ORF Transcript_35990/g.84348 Transcript_35990/m.84348 type:complete len:1072 (+) Transcript_35990:127-3342(+)
MVTPFTGASFVLPGAAALSGAAAVAIARVCYQAFSGRAGDREPKYCGQHAQTEEQEAGPVPDCPETEFQDGCTNTEDAASFLCACMSSAGLVAMAIDQRGVVVGWTERAERATGVKAEAALGYRLEHLVHQDSRQALSAAVTKTSRGYHEERLRIRFGEPFRELFVSASPLRNAAGRVAGMLVAGLDVTRLAERLDSAEKVAEDLSRLLETMNVPIIGMDREGSVTEWNRQAELLTGYSKADVMGRNLVGTMMVEESSRASFTKEVLEDGLRGVEATNYRFPIFTKAGHRREVLLSATTRRSGSGEAVGVLSVGQDITETRAESKMLASYVKICGAAVWFMWGCTKTGAATAWKTKDAEQLIAQESEMGSGDPRMVIWRVYFISILKTMCQSLWWRYKLATQDSPHPSFEYEFCFEAANGHVKWYKVEGHLIKESAGEREFEVTGSVRECTSMWIEKVMGDKYQKWWSCMCHMVFDATLLVDTQEYRVLNAWGEEKVFGCKLQPNCAVLQLLKADDHAVLKQCFNEVTYKGSERGRTMTLLQPGGKQKEIVAECFLLSADQENPNECMMGIRMDEPSSDGDVAALWNVTKPTRVLTLEDLARLKSGLKQHRRPVQAMRRGSADGRKRGAKRGGHASSLSLTSIPEDMAEGLRDGHDDDLPSVSSVAVGEEPDEHEDPLESGQSSGSASSTSLISECGNCNSDPRSVSEALLSQGGDHPGKLLNPPDASPRLAWQAATRTQLENFQQSFDSGPQAISGASGGFRNRFKEKPRGPPEVKIKWNGKAYDVNLDELESLDHLRKRIEELTSVPPFRQTLIHAGRRLPQSDEGDEEAAATEWSELRMSVRPKQPIMLIGSPAQEASPAPALPQQLSGKSQNGMRSKGVARAWPTPTSPRAVMSHGTPMRQEPCGSPVLCPKAEPPSNAVPDAEAAGSEASPPAPADAKTLGQACNGSQEAKGFCMSEAAQPNSIPSTSLQTTPQDESSDQALERPCSSEQEAEEASEEAGVAEEAAEAHAEMDHEVALEAQPLKAEEDRDLAENVEDETGEDREALLVQNQCSLAQSPDCETESQR